MNSRSQGGSVIKNGRIELMQNRRINRDDWRGMGEPLNETDTSGDGISVPATYQVQLFNRKLRKPLQRVVQQNMDQPPQYFFSFSHTVSNIPELLPRIVKGDLGKLLHENGMTDEMKLSLYAMGANQVLMRIENIADTFDSNGQVIFQTVNVAQIAKDLFHIANNGQFYNFKAKITETSLTANQSYEDMRNGRLKWKTVDDVTNSI